jgi:hypothetical protein
MTTDRGRDDDWGEFSGSASVVLDNRTRLFDPFYTSGTYYGKLLPRRQIRITATTPLSATVYPVFRGFITGWPPVWTDAGKDSTVTLHCFDALSLLASDNLPADWAHQYILTTSPRHYWQCNEPITPFVAGSVLKDYGSYPQNFASTVLASNGDQLAVGLVNSSVQGTNGISCLTDYGAIGSATSFTVSMWAVLDPDHDGCYGEIGNCEWVIGFQSSTSKYTVLILDGASGVYRQFTTTTTYDGGMARMIAFSFNQSSKAFALYMDGIAVATTVVTGAQLYIPVGEQTNIGDGQVQQLVIWSSVVSQAVIQEVYKYSVVAFSESTAARFTRLIAETQFPASLTSAPSAPATTVLDITDDAPPTSSELQKVADSEYAPLFVDRSGVLTLYYQNQIRTQTRSIVSQGTYGAGGIAIGQDVAIAYDGDSMRNTASITMSKGGVYEQSNATSVTAYGAAEASVDTQVASLANAQAIGNIVTGYGGQVYPKADPFEVVLSPSADWSNALDRELNDRIMLVIQPPTGNAITTPMLVSRISHSVVPGEWRTTFEGSARWAAVWIWGTSRYGGTDLLG